MGQNYPDKGEQYQIDLIFNYKENNIVKDLIYTSLVLEGTSQYALKVRSFLIF